MKIQNGSNIITRPIITKQKPRKNLKDNVSCKIKKAIIMVSIGDNDVINDNILTLMSCFRAYMYNVFAMYTENNDVIISKGI